jgi:hypothetical protein
MVRAYQDWAYDEAYAKTDALFSGRGPAACAGRRDALWRKPLRRSRPALRDVQRFQFSYGADPGHVKERLLDDMHGPAGWAKSGVPGLSQKDKDGSGFSKGERRAASAVPIDDGPRFFIGMPLSAAIIPRAFLN